MEIIKTPTGKIYVDDDRQLEFLTVGDYGKENNIKANFLGFFKKIESVKHSIVDLQYKWVSTISTQKGCLCNCRFCDVPKLKFNGNCSIDDLEYQIETILQNEENKYTKRFNVHYARMGEPTFNPAVIGFTMILDEVVKRHITTDVIHPVVSTCMPKYNKNLIQFLSDWCEIKNHYRNGEAGLQFSIQSTDDKVRNFQFNDQSLSLKEIAKIVEQLPTPLGRKHTLNFAVTKDSIVDAKLLDSMFDKNKFIVKLTPIHQTANAFVNGFDVSDTYRKYNVYEQFETPLLELGWDVIVFVPSQEEDESRITCGNALLSHNTRLLKGV